MTDKKHHRQKTVGGNQTSYNPNASQQFNQVSSGGANFTKKSYPKKNYTTFKTTEQVQPVVNKSVFEDPFEESSYLKFLIREKYQIFEDYDQKKKRLEVLSTLRVLIDKWQIEHAVTARKINLAEAEKKHAKILPFGSFEMGVHFPDTDMDLICVFPSYILQEDFFNTFKSILTEIKEVQNIIDVVDARVPILKFKFMGYQIDLLYACIDPKLLENNAKIQKLIKDESVFNKLNQVSQNSLNGLKATQNIIRSVPNPRKFRNTLRCIKLWAMRRGIYSNTFGYLGGVSYAILVAKICQDYPDLEMADLIYKFFDTYSETRQVAQFQTFKCQKSSVEWKWFDPVYIKIGKKKDNTKLDINKLQVLDAYSQDIMPILTPNTNPKNSAYRVCQHTFDTICKELYRGKMIMKELIPCTQKTIKQPVDVTEKETQDVQEEIKGSDQVATTLSQTKKLSWAKLYQKFRFFAQYEHFLKIDVLSTDDAGHLKWVGYVESQLRRLIQLLQDVEEIQGLRIYPRAFTREETKDSINQAFKCCDTYFIGIEFNETNPSIQINLREQVINFCNFLEIGRVTKQINNVRILHFKRSELPDRLDTEIYQASIQNNLDETGLQEQTESEHDNLNSDDQDYKIEQSNNKKSVDKVKIKTRRQSKGMVYFNRNKPSIEITIGSLEEWYLETQKRMKRRKMNTFIDDEEMKDDYFDLDKNKLKLNKTFLHENWENDFEKEKKKAEARNKKRKRSESIRSRSRSPTHVSSKGDLQNDMIKATKQRKGSVKSSRSAQGQIRDDQSSPAIDTEEEDRREAEKIKIDILTELNKKDEPMESQQLSTNLKYAQKYIEEGLKALLLDKKIQKKDIGKKAYYLAVNQEYLQNNQLNKQSIKEQIQSIREIEMKEQFIENDLHKLEKQIKELKIKPTTLSINNEITKLRDEIIQTSQDIEEFKQNPLYMGDNMAKKQKQLQSKLAKIVQIYQKRKDGCIDMLDYFSQHLNEEFDSIVRKCGIDQYDLIMTEDLAQIMGTQYQSDEIQELKKGKETNLDEISGNNQDELDD